MALHLVGSLGSSFAPRCPHRPSCTSAPRDPEVWCQCRPPGPRMPLWCPPVRVGAVLGSELPGAFSSVAPTLCLPADRGTGPRVQSRGPRGPLLPVQGWSPLGGQGPTVTSSPVPTPFRGLALRLCLLPAKSHPQSRALPGAGGASALILLCCGLRSLWRAGYKNTCSLP